jgi:hypothetical protein
MAWSLIAHAPSIFVSTANSDTTATPIDTTGADLLIVVGSQYSGVAAGTVTDSKGNTWTALTAQSATPEYEQMFYCQGGTVGAGHTFAFSGQFSSCAVAAFSGSVASPLDVQAGQAFAGAGSIAAGSVTPGQNDSLIVTGLGLAVPGAAPITVGSGFTITDTVPPVNPNYEGVGIAYLVQTTAAAINPTWTWSGTVGVAATNAVFKPGGGPPPPPPTGLFFRGVF